MRRLTFDGSHHTRAVWSPDATHLVFQGRPDGERNLHLMRLDGEAADVLLAPGPARTPTDWSLDGKHILYEQGSPARSELWTLKMPERTPARFLDSEFDLADGRFSPDGRFVAYVSNETGRPEVYVRSFPDARGVEKVSVNGGAAPRWSPDGRELFFVDADNLVQTVPVTTANGFEFGDPRPLFGMELPANFPAWLTTDGQRFLIVPDAVRPTKATPPITVAENWTSLSGAAGR